MKNKKILLGCAVFLFLVILASIFCYFKFYRYQVIYQDDLTAEINSEVAISDYIKSNKNVEITNANKIIDTSKLGKIQVNIHLKKFIGATTKTLKINVVDTQAPIISFNSLLSTNVGVEIDLLENVTAEDNSDEDIDVSVEGEYDFNTVGEYELKYIAEDSSGNKTQEDFTLSVLKVGASNNSSVAQSSTLEEDEAYPYYIKINRTQNVVMVYALEDGQYTKLVKVFICSTGAATPLGTYTTSDKYVWRALVGGVYGQYATRITGSILFHSVPYFSQSKDDLEYEEYNKLGTAASLGCIRLTVADAKWIYDNCPSGTTVYIFDSDSLDGITKPSFTKIDTNSPNRGWDPTDPDPANPWKT